MPKGSSSTVIESSGREKSTTVVGYGRALVHAPFEDRHRRIPVTQRPAPFGHTLRPGEQFKFDVSFAGNPSGLAEATVVSRNPDPRGPPPRGAPTLRLEGRARTSGVVSLVATVSDEMVSIIDATTGAPLSTTNEIRYQGFRPSYRHRVTVSEFPGRGYVRIVDKKDERLKRRVRHVPVDTLDPLSTMAWVRSLRLAPGESAKAHAMDGNALLRVEFTSRGHHVPEHLPGIATALGVARDEIELLEGVLTRVNEHDQALPGKKPYTFRAWVTSDERRIPLLMESDMWLGSIRLELAHYDPPR